MEEALYGPAGFYTGGRGAGRARDFLTSPEVGPLFGAVVANAIDAAWLAAGRPEAWVVVEVGAAAGALASAVLDAEPACATAMHYVAVEISRPLRAEAATALDGRAEVAASMPPVAGLVFANELLDNLPFDLYERDDDGWSEIRVDAELQELRLPASVDAAAELDQLAPAAPPGGRVPRQLAARSWLAAALATAPRVLTVDYARTTAEMAAVPVGQWLRTYRAGGPGASPLDSLGEQDMTADVSVDQLALVMPPASEQSQASWLQAHGIDALVDAARLAWEAAAARPGLAALKARSRIGEAAALRDPGGLGGFTVLEWAN